MLKEFSRLDGAFVISDAGKIVSAYQYLEPSIDTLDIPKGLGTRHNAAAAITDETEAVTIVLSEGDSRVRGFKNGDLIFNIDPNQLLIFTGSRWCFKNIRDGPALGTEHRTRQLP